MSEVTLGEVALFMCVVWGIAKLRLTINAVLLTYVALTILSWPCWFLVYDYAATVLPNWLSLGQAHGAVIVWAIIHLATAVVSLMVLLSRKGFMP